MSLRSRIWWFVCLWAALCTFFIGRAAAQCPPGWQPGDALPGVNGVVRAVLKLPDGRIVIGGNFTVAGGTFAACIAVWDGVRWEALGNQPLGDGTGSGGVGTVYALARLPNGDLVAGGNFPTVGSTPVNGVARWDGSSWRPIGNGLTPNVYALAVLPNGDLVAGGGALVAGGGSGSSCVAKWNGSAWQSVGGAVMNVGGVVNSLLPLSDGRLLVGGSMTVTFTGGGSVSNLAVWNGVSWSALGSGAPNSTVRSIVQSPTGDVLIGGNFGQVGAIAARGVAGWNGTAWAGFGSGVGGVNQIAFMSNGDPVAVGGFYETVSGGTLAAVARWNGSAWVPLSGGLRNGGNYGRIGYGVAVGTDDRVFVGGDFALADGLDALCVATWNGSSWSAVPRAGGASAGVFPIRAMAVGPDGTVYGAGDFSVLSSVPLRGRVYRRTDAGWQQLGGDLTGTENGGLVRALTVLPGGDVVVGGAFSDAGGVSVSHIARWDGAAWRPLGAGVNGPVSALAVAPSGTLYVSGSFYTTGDGATALSGTASWNDSVWAALPPMGSAALGTSKLAVASNGDVVFFSGRVGRWNGSAWTDCGSPVASGLGAQPTALAAASNGDILASAWFWNASVQANVARVMRLRNGVWTQLGGDLSGGQTSQVLTLSVLQNGDVFAGGTFTAAGGVPAKRAARWDGSSWSEFAGGVGYAPFVTASVMASAALADGDLAVGGFFVSAGSGVSAYFARFSAGGGGITVNQQPTPVSVCIGSTAQFAVSATCSDPVFYRWLWNGEPIDAASNPSAVSPVLTIAHASAANEGRYTCELTARCAAVTSEPAVLFVDLADMGRAGGIPGRDGTHDNNDFIAFIGLFFQADARADVGASGGVVGSDSHFDNNDFIAFIGAFFDSDACD